MSLTNPTTWFKAQAQPLQINANSADLLARHIGRLANLYSAMGATTDGFFESQEQKELSAEIKQRKAAIAVYGHPAPDNEQEARDLLAKVKGA